MSGEDERDTAFLGFDVKTERQCVLEFSKVDLALRCSLLPGQMFVKG
jgi:hypothetical protein